MADVKYKAEGVVQVNTRLNVRRGNGTGTGIIGKLYRGNKVQISHKTSDKKFNDYGTMRGGYKISYKGSSAYVCDRYVKITKEFKDPEKPKKPAEKPKAEPDIYILTGKANIEPNLSVRVGETVDLKGLGKYLSGAYFVEEVEYTIDRNGLSQSLSVSKNAFGASINTPPPPKKTNNTTKPSAPKPVKPPQPKQRTHTLKRGESLWSLSVKYYGTGTKWQHIAKANGIGTDDKSVRRIPDGKKLTIPYL